MKTSPWKKIKKCKYLYIMMLLPIIYYILFHYLPLYGVFIQFLENLFLHENVPEYFQIFSYKFQQTLLYILQLYVLISFLLALEMFLIVVEAIHS